MRANFPDSREDLDDFEARLTYQTPAVSESHEKLRETFRKPSEG